MPVMHEFNNTANSLMQLNSSVHLAITTLDITYIRYQNEIDVITEIIQHSTKLDKLVLDLVYVNDANLNDLFHALKTNTCIKSLELHRISVAHRDASITTLANALKNNTSIESVQLNLCRFTEQDYAALADAFQTNTHIKNVNLASNSINA